MNNETEKDVEIKVRRSRAQWFAKFRDQPLRNYIAGCYGCHWDLQQDQPKSPLFWFTWLVKGHDEMSQYLAQPADALEEVELHLNRMSRHARRAGRSTRFGTGTGDPWREWFDLVGADAKAEFYDTWQKIRYRPGHGPLEQAFTANVRERLLVPQHIREKRRGLVSPPEEWATDDYEFFIGLAGHLQVAMGVRNILLPCGDVADLMGVTPMTVTRYRRYAVEDGLLKLTKPHRYKSGGGGKATEFRANPHLWEGLVDRITTGTPAPDAEEMEWCDW